jgi:hypothetical protein
LADEVIRFEPPPTREHRAIVQPIVVAFFLRAIDTLTQVPSRPMARWALRRIAWRAKP